jgi:hypothetical protein
VLLINGVLSVKLELAGMMNVNMMVLTSEFIT